MHRRTRSHLVSVCVALVLGLGWAMASVVADGSSVRDSHDESVSLKHSISESGIEITDGFDAAISESDDPFAENFVKDCEACADPEGGHEHNHASDHGPSVGEIGSSQEGPSFFSRLARYTGKLHPMVVHFPIALIIAAALAELLFAFTTLDSMRQAARFSLTLAALTAPMAAWMGWLNADVANYPGAEHILFYHRWIGTSTAVLAVLAFLTQCRVKTSSPSLLTERIYRIVLFLAVLFVSAAGHLGASLVYGTEYLLTF